MSKDLKGLIDDVEEDVKTRSELEYSVENLTEEIKKLNIKIEEQETMLQKRESGAGVDFDIPDDIRILKEMIQTQREELTKKDHEIDSLKDKSDSSGLDEKELEQLSSKLSETEKSLAKLTDEIEMYRVNDENAREMIIKLSEENDMYKANEENSIKILEELAEKKEKYKNKSKELEMKLGTLNDSNTNVKSNLITEFEAEKEKLTVSNVKYVEKINELEAQLQKMSESSDDRSPIQSEKENLERKNQEYEEKIEKLESKLQKLSESSGDAQQVIDAEKEMLKEKNIEYKEKITDLETRVQELSQQSNDVVEVEKDILTEQAEKYKSRVKELQKELQKISKVNQEEKTFLEKEKDELSATNIDYVKKISELEAQLQNSSTTSTMLQSPQPEVVQTPPPNESSNIDTETASIIEDPHVGIADSVRKCPACGNQRKALIHEELDKNNIIMSYPRMYGKKYRCGECGGEWRINLEGASLILKDSTRR